MGQRTSAAPDPLSALELRQGHASGQFIHQRVQLPDPPPQRMLDLLDGHPANDPVHLRLGAPWHFRLCDPIGIHAGQWGREGPVVINAFPGANKVGWCRRAEQGRFGAPR